MDCMNHFVHREVNIKTEPHSLAYINEVLDSVFRFIFQ